ncbi:MAG: NUDIX hydrolase [Hyphomicrobiales bacterium]
MTLAGGARQVAALCWRKRKGRTEILLITSRETKRWVIPKGWPMPPLKDYNAARREAFEEAGVSGHMSRLPIGHFTYAKRSKGLVTDVRVDVYDLEVTREHKSWPEKRERLRHWVLPEEAAFRVNEDELKRLIAGFA